MAWIEPLSASTVTTPHPVKGRVVTATLKDGNGATIATTFMNVFPDESFMVFGEVTITSPGTSTAAQRQRGAVLMIRAMCLQLAGIKRAWIDVKPAYVNLMQSLRVRVRQLWSNGGGRFDADDLPSFVTTLLAHSDANGNVV